MPYCALYVLDQAQLEAMLADPSHIWSTGTLAFDWQDSYREKIASGWYFEDRPQKDYFSSELGWQSRSLIPVDIRGKVTKDAIVWHQSNKYSRKQGLPLDAMVSLTPPIKPILLPNYSSS